MARDRTKSLDVLALFLLAFAMLNLNSVALLLFQREALLSLPVALPITLYLIVRYARAPALGQIYLLFCLFFALFLLGAVAPALGGREIDNARFLQYVITVLFTSSIYFWASTLDDAEFERTLQIAKGMLLIAALATIFSRQLATYFHYSLDLERASGFFENPNEAAVAAVYCIVLIVAFPTRSATRNLIFLSIALGALILTFSRSGLLTLIVLYLLYLLHHPSKRGFGMLIVGVIAVSWTLWAVFEYDLFELNSEQRRRLADIVGIATGEVRETGPGGRSDLWTLGLSRIGAVFPWGAGMGQLHHMEHGFRAFHNPTDWLGVHNTYLMVLGEAGLAAFVALLAFMGWLGLRLLHSANRIFAVGAFIVMQIDMMGAHGVLGHRLSNAMLALLMAAAARAAAPEHALVSARAPPSGDPA